MVPPIEARGRWPGRQRGSSEAFLVVGVFAILALGSNGSRSLEAHDGLHVDIDKITAQIAAETAPRADLYLIRARLLRHHGKPTEALADCDRAAELIRDGDPSWLARAEVPLERGLVLLALEQPEKALPYLERVIEHAKGRYPEAYDARGWIRYAKGEFESALADADSAFEASPTPDRALRRGAWWEERGLLDRAAASYRDSIAKLGPSRLVQDRLIAVETARGEYESALALIEEELARAAVKTIWLLRRAEVYAAAGNDQRCATELEAALTEANRVLERRRLPVHLVVRAEVFLALGDWDRAEGDVREALTVVPNFPRAEELLVEIGNRRDSKNVNRAPKDRAPADRAKQEGESRAN